MKSLIGNEWTDSSDGKVINVIDPATGSLIDTVPSLTKEDVERAIDESVIASKKWAKVPLLERCSIMMKFNDLVKAHRDELASLLCKENGKPIKEAYAEIDNVAIAVPAFTERIKHIYDEVIPEGQEKGNENTIQMVIRQPKGVIVAIIPFNFPSDLFCQKVPPALLAGNSVILKPASSNPLTLTRYVELLVEAGVPKGAIEVVHGSGATVGSLLTSSPKVNSITLTGSTAAGIDAAKNAASNLTTTTLELGGNDAMIICADGDLDLAVDEVVWGRLYNIGQVCCASKRFIVEASVKDEFIRKMTEKIKSLKLGDPKDPSTDIGCLISEEAAINIEKQVNKTIEEGAKLVIGGRRNGAFYEPTILDNVTKDMEIAKDMEIFGPVIPVISFDNIDEAVEIANQSIFGLSGAIITKDMNKAFKVAKNFESGGFVINGASFFRAFEQPFGGWKYSGYGNEGVMTTFDEVTRKKTIILKNITK